MRKHCLLLAQLGRNKFMSISSLKISASSVSMFIAMNNTCLKGILKECQIKLLLHLEKFITCWNETYRMMQFKDILSLVISLRADLGRGCICLWQDLELFTKDLMSWFCTGLLNVSPILLNVLLYYSFHP